MKICGVYKIWCKETKKNYVGSSAKDIHGRMAHHRFLLKSGKHPARSMQADWDKYGSESFIFQPLMECAPEAVLSLEEAAVKEYDALNPEKGYNGRPVAGKRHRGGRPRCPGGRVRFSCYLPREKAVGISDLIQADKEGLILLEHGRKSWVMLGDKVVGRREEEYDFEKRERWAMQDPDMAPVKMVVVDSAEVASLKARVKQLEEKIKEYENMA
jgi:hypothetical protein